MTRSTRVSGTAGRSSQKNHDALQFISSLFFHGTFLFPLSIVLSAEDTGMHSWGLDTTAWQLATVLHIKWDPSPGCDVDSTKGFLTFWLSYISGSWVFFWGGGPRELKRWGLCDTILMHQYRWVITGFLKLKLFLSKTNSLRSRIGSQ